MYDRTSPVHLNQIWAFTKCSKPNDSDIGHRGYKPNNYIIWVLIP